MTTGEQLRAWREENRLSQDKAARRVGTTQRTWASWETDGTTPEIDFAEAIERLTSGRITMLDWARSRRRTRRQRRRPASGPSSSRVAVHGGQQ